jgi:glutaredoxin 3
MHKVEIHTTPWCPYCHAAKALLNDRGVPYDEVDVTDPQKRAAMIQKAHGRRTVPQIFIGGHHVGGYTDLVALDRQGRLEAILADEAA